MFWKQNKKNSLFLIVFKINYNCKIPAANCVNNKSEAIREECWPFK